MTSSPHEPSGPDSDALSPGWQRGLRWLLIAMVYLAAAGSTLDTFMDRWGLDSASPNATFVRMLERSADRPYVHRLLVPVTAKAIALNMPSPIRRQLEAPRGERGLSLADRVVERYGHGHEDPLLYASTYALVGIACLFLPWIWRQVLHEPASGLPTGSRWLKDAAPVGLVLLLPLCFGRGGYLYDLPALALLSLAFLFFQKERPLLFALCLGLAVLNKEAALLALAWPAARIAAKERQEERQAALRFAFPAVASATALATATLSFYRHHPGGIVEHHLAGNLASWFDAGTWLHARDVFAAGLPTPQGFNLLNVAMVAGLLAAGWKTTRRETRLAFTFAALLTLPLFLAFGYRDEVRVFDTALPPFLVLASQALQNLWGTARGRTQEET